MLNLKKIFRILRKCLNTFYFLLCRKSDILVINAWIDLYGESLKHSNLGDDLNFFLLKELTGKRLFNYGNLYIPWLKNYCCIGSIIDSLSNKHSIIWGSGIISENKTLKYKPLKVCAVRGHLTKQYLESYGIDCPSIYGDPALLLPLVYPVSTKSKKKSIGIIPHIWDFHDEKVLLLSQKIKNSKVINLKEYKHCQDVIKEINECEFIISSSLHGIIISDAYQIPNVWVEFSDKVEGEGFKFRDYFSSIGRFSSPIRITNSTTLQELLVGKQQWHTEYIDLNKLLDSCPFEIKPKFKEYCTKKSFLYERT